MLLITFIILLVLKLAGVIAWSWWIVFAPLITIPVLFALGFLAMFSVITSADRHFR